MLTKFMLMLTKFTVFSVRPATEARFLCIFHSMPENYDNVSVWLMGPDTIPDRCMYKVLFSLILWVVLFPVLLHSYGHQYLTGWLRVIQTDLSVLYLHNSFNLFHSLLFSQICLISLNSGSLLGFAQLLLLYAATYTL